MVLFLRLPDNWLLSYPPYLPPDLNIHANYSNPTPFESPHQADSNGLSPDLIRPLVQELSTPLYFCFLGRYLQIVCYGLLQACRDFEPYTLRFFLTSRFQSCPSR